MKNKKIPNCQRSSKV